MTRAHASEKNDSIGKTQGILDIDFSLLLKAEIDLFFLGVDIKKEEEDLDSNELDQNGLPQPGKSNDSNNDLTHSIQQPDPK